MYPARDQPTRRRLKTSALNSLNPSSQCSCLRRQIEYSAKKEKREKKKREKKDCATQLPQRLVGVQFLGLAAVLVLSVGTFEGSNLLSGDVGGFRFQHHYFVS